MSLILERNSARLRETGEKPIAAGVDRKVHYEF
jgi:hypothetical protein